MIDCTAERTHLAECAELLRLIGDEDKAGHREAMERILAMGLDLTFPALEEALRGDRDADSRSAAMEVLVRFGACSVARLIPLLLDRDEEVRTFGALVLGKVASRDAVPALIEALKDRDTNVCHSAAEALGRIGDCSAAPALIELLSEDFWLQFPAVIALAKMRATEAVPHLVRLLPDEMLTEVVIEALGKIGDRAALPHLWEIVGRGPLTFFSCAAWAIVQIRDNLAAAGDAAAAAVPEEAVLERLQLLADDGPSAEKRECAARLLRLGEGRAAA